MKKDTEKSRRTKQLIYDTAIDLFQSKGYDKATMREIASKAGVSLGLAYYHFATKEKIVFNFYESTQIKAEQDNIEYCKQEKDFKKRIRKILITKIEQFNPYEKFLHVLARSSMDPKNPLSPFSKETESIRQEAIGIFDHAIQGSNFSCPEDLKSALPSLLWIYQMGIIYFWNMDSSESKKKTIELIDFSLDLILKLLRLSKFPFMRTIRKSLIKIYKFVVSDN